MSIKGIMQNAARRKKKKYDDIAEILGISRQTYANTLSRGNMNSRTVEKVAEYLDCDIVFIDRKTGDVYCSYDD